MGMRTPLQGSLQGLHIMGVVPSYLPLYFSHNGKKKTKKTPQSKCLLAIPEAVVPVPGLRTTDHRQGSLQVLYSPPGHLLPRGLSHPALTNHFLDPSSTCVCFLLNTLLIVLPLISRAVL